MYLLYSLPPQLHDSSTLYSVMKRGSWLRGGQDWSTPMRSYTWYHMILASWQEGLWMSKHLRYLSTKTRYPWKRLRPRNLSILLLISNMERPGWNTMGEIISDLRMTCIDYAHISGTQIRSEDVRGSMGPKFSFSSATSSRPWNTEYTWWTSAGSH